MNAMKITVAGNDTDGLQYALGGKASALYRLARSSHEQFQVPEWFVVLPEAFWLCMDKDKALQLKAATHWEETAAILQHPLNLDVIASQVNNKVAEISASNPDGQLWAVRSSGADEDGGVHSFAGQFESFLNVDSHAVVHNIAEVWRSGFSERVYEYRLEQGLSCVFDPPAVIVQVMVPAEQAGVAFSIDPVTECASVCVVSAVEGLGEGLVSGEKNADTYKVNVAGEVIARESALAGDNFCLTDLQVNAIAELARGAAAYFERPQDIEWAWCRGQLFILQSRAITSLGNAADPQGAVQIWDNSNIAESYNGVTTPLTFSFARCVYEEVYMQFCSMLNVPEKQIRKHRDVFAQMLGLIDGRIYYNLLSWYRVLALLPGFKFNQQFMEQMMGVGESLPEDVLAGLQASSSDAGEISGLGSKVSDGLHLLMTVGGLILQRILLPRSIRVFNSRLARVLRMPDKPFCEQRADELVKHYRGLENELLSRWDAPLINDFLAMIYFGVLRKLCGTWLGEKGESLANDLVGGEGGMISIEPARMVQQMASIASENAVMTDALVNGNLDTIASIMAGMHSFKQHYDQYLQRFGNRCMEELKLESPTLQDEPLTLFRSIGALATMLRKGKDDGAAHKKFDARAIAEQQMARALQGHPIRRFIFKRVLKQTRLYVKERENLRFERTRLFGRVREVFLEIGKRLVAFNILASKRDIFYLTVEEVLGYVEGASITLDLKALVALRRDEFERYQTKTPPSNRFNTRGMVYVGNTFQSAGEVDSKTSDALRGLACCPGVVQGRARVILDPRNAEIQEGEILIAARTDPGWVMLFPSAAGLLVEYGSLLSHSAIVARELGLPAVVAIPGVTRLINTGDWIEMDGSRGTVRILEAVEQDD